MDPESSLNNLQSQQAREQSPQKDDTGHPDIKVIKERFLNALKEIARLERIIEEKNTQLAVTAEEKDRLLHSLDKAFEKERQLHDKIADLDILRNVELLEAREEVKLLTNEINRLNKESGSLIEEVFKKDKIIEELRHIPEGKEPEHGVAETKLYPSGEDMEGRYKDLAGYKAIEKERDGLKEKLIMATSDLAKKAEIASEHLNRLEEFKKTISGLTMKMDEKIKENSSIKNEISEFSPLLDENKKGVNKSINDLEETLQLKKQEMEALKSLYDADTKRLESEIERLSAEKSGFEKTIRDMESRNNEYLGELSSKDKLISELKEQMDKDISWYPAEMEKPEAEKEALSPEPAEGKKEVAPTEESKGEEPAADRYAIELKSPAEEKEGGAPYDKAARDQKMIYIESSRFSGINMLAIGVAVFIIISVVAWFVFRR
ncbi:MAG: hypothetical protein Q7T83_12355 [Thermodesulfovibrionales bacterium]|nr:hypothetical protein [Thermodesulfovibrionales bacterium]